jgi:hypothetical protein
MWSATSVGAGDRTRVDSFGTPRQAQPLTWNVAIETGGPSALYLLTQHES